MKKLLFIAAASFFSLSASTALAQTLPTAWDELTGPDFITAIEKSRGVCVVPMGVIEKHGPHMPLGTDVLFARGVALRAAAKEYAIVYPYYFTGQIHEAKHQPGTIAYSPELIYKMLEETCAEISRNGIKKIILANTHGGNTTFLEYFCQSQLASPKDYVVYLFTPSVDGETQRKINALRKSTTGGHADEVETSGLLVTNPELMKMEEVNAQSGRDLDRLSPQNFYTGIWWYAKFPNHYAGESSGASAEIGELYVSQRVDQLAGVIKAVKEDGAALRLQNEFFRESASPLETPVR
jgi:creatinine amidohydrolase